MHRTGGACVDYGIDERRPKRTIKLIMISRALGVSAEWLSCSLHAWRDPFGDQSQWWPVCSGPGFAGSASRRHQFRLQGRWEFEHSTWPVAHETSLGQGVAN